MVERESLGMKNTEGATGAGAAADHNFLPAPALKLVPQTGAPPANFGNMAYDDTMSTPTREDLDSQSRHIDERLDSHFRLLDERLKAQSDLLLQWRQGQEKIADERDARQRDASTQLRKEFSVSVSDIKQTVASAQAEAKTEAKSLRTTLLTTAIGSIIAIVGGIAAFNATVLSNMVASFESGKNTAASLTQATDQLKQVQDDVSKTQAQVKMLLDRLPASPASSPKG
jgi:hypothetical protein